MFIHKQVPTSILKAKRDDSQFPYFHTTFRHSKVKFLHTKYNPALFNGKRKEKSTSGKQVGQTNSSQESLSYRPAELKCPERPSIIWMS